VAISDTTETQIKKTTHQGLKKNAFYINGGTLGESYSYFNGNYERMIWGNKNPVIQSLFVRLGIGKYKGWVMGSLFSSSELKATTYLTTVGGLIGKKNSFFEFGLGAMYSDGIETNTSGWSRTVRTYEYHEFLPVFNCGYRFQKPGGYFIFRTGLGFPEVYYLSLGFCI
jgi:hypothetical protein